MALSRLVAFACLLLPFSALAVITVPPPQTTWNSPAGATAQFGPSWVTTSSSTLGVTSSANLTYFFAINSPDQLQVPVDISYYLNRSSSLTGPDVPLARGTLMSSSALLIQALDPSLKVVFSVFSSFSDLYLTTGVLHVLQGVDPGAGQGSATILTNTLYQVGLTAKIQATFNGPNTNLFPTNYAYADPLIVIDPDFLLLHPELSISFSAGIENGFVPDVPEPSTFALLTIGLLLLGIAARGRSRQETPETGV